MQTVMVKGRVFNYSHTLGRNASSGPGFRHPMDIALAPNGHIYVVSRGDEYMPCQRVSIQTIDEEFIGEFGSYGQGDGQFIWPTACATDRQGNVYVADEWLQRISIFDKDGKYLGKWGTYGSQKGQLNGPTGLTFDADDNLLVTENLNHRVQKFTKDGMPLQTWGSEGEAEGQFNRPWGIAIDAKGDVYVADWHNHRIQKFNADGSYLATIGTPGEGKGELKFPSDAAVDKDGDIYVANWWKNTVEVFDPSGTHLTTFIGDAEKLSKWAQQSIDANPDYKRARLLVKNVQQEWRFNRPTAIAVTPKGQVLVVENQRMRIQVYQKEENWTDPQFNL
jgi:DNA-binding beta-propeller fold protein YncE